MLLITSFPSEITLPTFSDSLEILLFQVLYRSGDMSLRIDSKLSFTSGAVFDLAIRGFVEGTNMIRSTIRR